MNKQNEQTLRKPPVYTWTNTIGDANPLSLSFHFEPRPDNPHSPLNLFSQLNLGPSNSDNMASSSAAPSTSPKEVKLNMTPLFLGKREDLTKFWQDCSVYIAINNEIYNTDNRQIAFVLSLLTWSEAPSQCLKLISLRHLNPLMKQEMHGLRWRSWNLIAGTKIWMSTLLILNHF